MNEGHIWIDTVIDADTYESVKAQLSQLQAVDEIVLHIASPGGSVRQGNKIYHLLKNSGKTIKPLVEGEASSMASYLALMGPSKICNPSTFMIHLPQNEVAGTAEDLIQGANELLTIGEEMAQAYAAKTGLPIDRIKEMMKVETRMNAQQAKELGFIDEVIGSFAEAVALGITIKKPMEQKEKKSKFDKVITMLGELTGITVAAPKAIDLKTKDGKMLNVQSEDGALPGKPATIDGQPANGTYMLEDGRSITCENGIVMSVQEAAAAVAAPVTTQPATATVVPPVTATAEQILAAKDKELQELKAMKEASDKAKAEAEKSALEAKEAQANALKKVADVQKELVALSQEPAGNQEPPMRGITNGPAAIGALTTDEKKAIYASRTWMVQNHPSWERRYKGKFPDGTTWDSYRMGGPNAVSILETNFNYAYNGVLTDEIFYKPTLSGPALSDLFMIDTDASDKKRYNLLLPLSKILQPYTGCGGTPAGNRVQITNTTLQLKPFQMYESWCKDDFTGQLSGLFNYLAEIWLKTGNNSFDPAGTPIDRIITDVLKDALRRDVFRRASFAAGNSSDSDYNQIDGLWDRLIDSSGASNYCVVRSGSALGLAALSDGQSNTILTGLWENSNLLLKEYGIDNGKAVIWVTRSIWDNYYKYLVGVGAVTEQAYSNYISGLNTLTFRGIPVKPVSLWDSFLQESDNPLFAVTRHLALLTVKDNHILGVENTSDLERIDSWFEQKDQKRYYRSNMTFGYQYLHCDLQTIAY